MNSDSTNTSEQGSSLIESMIALTILAVSLVFILDAATTFIRLNERSQARSNAAAAARTRLEQLRFEDPATLPETGAEVTLTSIGPHHFQIVTEYCTNTSYCDDGTRHVVVNVQEEGQDVFEAETVITQLR